MAEQDGGFWIPPGGSCAACRFRRRGCVRNCPLAPYFPNTNMQQFLNAHRLFGASNIIKSLKAVPPEQRDDAANAIIYTANARAQDPVGGCHRIVCGLLRRQQRMLEELDYVLEWIERLRSMTRRCAERQKRLHMALKHSKAN